MTRRDGPIGTIGTRQAEAAPVSGVHGCRGELRQLGGLLG
jgi:hypothetical protein